MRRTLALAGAAVLAIGVSGLTGPAAAADSGAGVAQDAGIAVNEVAADLDTMVGFDHLTGDLAELYNPHETDSVVLEDYELWACDATSGFNLVTEFKSIHVIGPEEFLLVGDNVYRDGDGPARDADFAPDADLEQAAGGVQLLDPTSQEVDSIKWGDVSGTPCESFPDAGATPDDHESLQFDGTTWCAASPPTPKATNVSCS